MDRFLVVLVISDWNLLVFQCHLDYETGLPQALVSVTELQINNASVNLR